MTIGIDFGTTNSVMAFLDGDIPRIIPNDRGARLTPSVVAYTPDGDVLVGDAAKNQAVSNPEHTFFSIKRDLGTGRRFSRGSKSVSAEEVAAQIFSKLRRDAEAYLGVRVTRAVVTVPANFDELRRRSVIAAAESGGLQVVSLLNEPTAAALSYAETLSGDARVLVYDLGGGTFDATYLEKKGSNYRVLASMGDNHLGGLDFDRGVFRLLNEEFAPQAGMDMTSEPRLSRQILDLAERAKIELSDRPSATVGLPFLAAGGGMVHLSRDVRRSELEAIIGDSIRRTLDLTRRTISEGGGRAPQALILSGGSSRIPLVRRVLGEAFGLQPSARVNPEEAVALGAAARTGHPQGGSGLRDVTSLSLGVEIDQDRFIPIIRRNTPIPTEKKKLFTTIADNQTVVEIHVLQGDHARASRNVSLGKFRLKGLAPLARGEIVVEVTFSQDVNGLLTVTAAEESSGKREGMSVGRTRLAGAKPYTVTREHTRIRSLSETLGRSARRLDRKLDPSFRREIRELRNMALGVSPNAPEADRRSVIIGLETALAELESLELEAEHEQA